jgi:hypothetical protein
VLRTVCTDRSVRIVRTKACTLVIPDEEPISLSHGNAVICFFRSSPPLKTERRSRTRRFYPDRTFRITKNILDGNSFENGIRYPKSEMTLDLNSNRRQANSPHIH